MFEAFNCFEQEKKELKQYFSLDGKKSSKITCQDSKLYNWHSLSLIFEWSNGHKLVYKSLSFSGENYYSQATSRSQSCGQRLYIPKILDKDTFGWMEYID